MIEITIPLLPPSVNTYWRRGQHTTYLKKVESLKLMLELIF